MAVIFKLINYSGALAFILMVLSLAYVVFGPKLQLHKLFGMLAFDLACIHVALIMYKSWKVRSSRKRAG